MNASKWHASALVLSLVLVSGSVGGVLQIAGQGFVGDRRAVAGTEERADTASACSTITVRVTAYSSTREETDSTPRITASGTATRDGIVAANFLPFGTRIRIPELFGNRIFVVEDRMHRRKKQHVDVWMRSKRAAIRFGIQRTEVVIVPNETTS